MNYRDFPSQVKQRMDELVERARILVQGSPNPFYDRDDWEPYHNTTPPSLN